MHLIVHVTGGGIISKLGEGILFPRGLSANLDDLWDPPEIMASCAQWRDMSHRECYEVWNGGQCVLVVVDETDTDQFIGLAGNHGIEARRAGRIIRGQSSVLRIESKFPGGESLSYEPKKS